MPSLTIPITKISVFLQESRAVTGAGETCAALLLVNTHTNTEIQI